MVLALITIPAFAPGFLDQFVPMENNTVMIVKPDVKELTTLQWVLAPTTTIAFAQKFTNRFVQMGNNLEMNVKLDAMDTQTLSRVSA